MPLSSPVCYHGNWQNITGFYHCHSQNVEGFSPTSFGFFCSTMCSTVIRFVTRISSTLSVPYHWVVLRYLWFRVASPVYHWGSELIITSSSFTQAFPGYRVLPPYVPCSGFPACDSVLQKVVGIYIMSVSSRACPRCSVAVLVSCFRSSEKDKCVFSPSQRDHLFPAVGSCVTGHLIVFRALRGSGSCTGPAVFTHTHTHGYLQDVNKSDATWS